jgi:starvation-inducible DNA-binding protein
MTPRDRSRPTKHEEQHHWQTSGAAFYQLHLLLDAHYKAQAGLADMIAKRIMALGGISIAMASDIAEITKIRAHRGPRGHADTACPPARNA